MSAADTIDRVLRPLVREAMKNPPEPPIVQVETANVDARPAPIPASVAMPDHEVRSARWYQIYVRLARPTLDWITNGGVAYTIIIGPAIERPPSEGLAIITLSWASIVYGLKTLEKTKGLA